MTSITSDSEDHVLVGSFRAFRLHGWQNLFLHNCHSLTTTRSVKPNPRDFFTICRRPDNTSYMTAHDKDKNRKKWRRAGRFDKPPNRPSLAAARQRDLRRHLGAANNQYDTASLISVQLPYPESDSSKQTRPNWYYQGQKTHTRNWTRHKPARCLIYAAKETFFTKSKVQLEYLTRIFFKTEQEQQMAILVKFRCRKGTGKRRIESP